MEHIIYKLTSPSGKIYIGQSKSPLELRFKQHLQAWNKWLTDPDRKRSKLYHAFSKYDPDTWVKEVIFETDSEYVDHFEQYFIEYYDAIDSGYNILKGGQGFRKDNLEEVHKENISKSRKEFFETDEGQEWKEKLSEMYSGENNPNYGKRYSHTEETKRKMSENSQGKNKGKEPWNKGEHTMSEENKKALSDAVKQNHKNGKYDYDKMAETRKGFKQSDHQKEKARNTFSKDWVVIDPDGNTYEITNLRQFCMERGLDPGNIQRGGSKKWKAYRKDT